jgi:hypothetical protein
MIKNKNTGAYPCPDVYDIADGAMWNNKVDNMLIYHRPLNHKDRNDPSCELHAVKIRRQKIVGIKGTAEFQLDRISRRFLFNGHDYASHFIREGKEGYLEIKEEKPEPDVNDIMNDNTLIF